MSACADITYIPVRRGSSLPGGDHHAGLGPAGMCWLGVCRTPWMRASDTDGSRNRNGACPPWSTGDLRHTDQGASFAGFVLHRALAGGSHPASMDGSGVHRCLNGFIERLFGARHNRGRRYLAAHRRRLRGPGLQASGSNVYNTERPRSGQPHGARGLTPAGLPRSTPSVDMIGQALRASRPNPRNRMNDRRSRI